jgi:hypothetical protein
VLDVLIAGAGAGEARAPFRCLSTIYLDGVATLILMVGTVDGPVLGISAAQAQRKPIKRKLVFDGRRNDVLMFSERIYKKSIDTASIMKPLLVSVPSLAAKVRLDRLEINVLRVEEHALTFEVTTPWH